MTLKYGTSGFRCDSEKLIKYSEKIGESLSHLMIICNNLKGILSVIVTASHNPKEDNGIKIVDFKGQMINKLQSEYLEYYINNNKKQKIFLNKTNFKLIIGKDTRETGKEIINLISKGIKKVANCNIIDVGYITTPIIHFLSINYKKINNKQQAIKFIEEYSQNIKNTKIKYKPYIDCSGGVGGTILEKNLNNNLKLVCTPQDNILNYNCGSDFLMNSKKLPDVLNIMNNIYGCSLDGDADRSVFWTKKRNKLFILDGDYQLLLLSLFLKKKNINLVAITTSYCNGAAIELLKQNNIDVKITATGMKNLIEEAEKHENTVYFESNGHGTMKIKEEIILKNGQKLVYNNLIGDGIYNIFTFFQILEELDMDMEDWYNLYKKIPNCQFKIPSDKFPELEMNNIGNIIMKPSYIQEKLDIISQEYKGRVFVRPSGTEPVVRFYCESEHNLEKMVKCIFKIFNL